MASDLKESSQCVRFRAGNAAGALAVLEGLVKVPRFDLAVMMLDDEDRAGSRSQHSVNAEIGVCSRSQGAVGRVGRQQRQDSCSEVRRRRLIAIT